MGHLLDLEGQYVQSSLIPLLDSVKQVIVTDSSAVTSEEVNLFPEEIWQEPNGLTELIWFI